MRPRSTSPSRRDRGGQGLAPPPPTTSSRGSASGFSLLSSNTSTSDGRALPSYRYLVFSHLTALVPTLLFLVTFGVLALRQRCHLPLRDHSDDDSRLSYAHCSRMLGASSSLGWSLFLMGLTGYAAVNKIRSLISRAATLCVSHSSENNSAVLACALRAAFTEAFRIPLIVTATGVVLAELTLRNHNRQIKYTGAASNAEGDISIFASHGNDRRPSFLTGLRWTMLDPRDARFRVAVWLALGWSFANFLTGSVKLMRNLTLYTPLYLGVGEDAITGVVLLDGDDGDDDEVDEEERIGTTTATATATIGDLAATGDDVRVRQTIADMPAKHPAVETPTTDTAGGSIYRGQVPETRRPANQQRTPRPRGRGRFDRTRMHTPGAGRRPPSGTDGNGDDDYFGPHAAAVDAAETRSQSSTAPSSASSDLSILVKLEDQIDRLVAARRRVKLEQSLGASLPELPSALAALWRLDDALWSVGSILLIASAVAIGQGPILSTSAGTGNELLSSTLMRHHRHRTKEDTASLWPDSQDIWAVYLALSILHSGFNSVFTLALASWGWPAVTYSSLLVGIAVMVAGLARWGLVV